MNSKIFVTRIDLLKEAEERGVKNVTAMRKYDLAEKLGVNLTPKPKMSIAEKRKHARIYQRRYHQKNIFATQRRGITGDYMYNIFMYIIILFLFVMNRTLLSF